MRSKAIRSLACAALLAALGAWVGAPAAPAVQTATLVVTGAGDGHGVGMSQDGAYGFARHSFGYQAILAHYYSGTSLGQAPSGAVVRVLVGSKVQNVPLEKYVRGVISAEVPAEWPLAALEAQAVASRTYALTAHAGGQRFDVYSDTRSQVYRGVAAETSRTNAAVAATAGQIVTYRGKPAITYFFASSGGMTESVQNGFPGSEPEPWLHGVADPYEARGQSSWRVSLGFAAASVSLQGLVKGRFRGIEVLKRGYSPRIVTAAVLGSAGRTVIGGPELAAALGLQDTWAYFGVRSGSGPVKPEPDRSGWRAAASPPAAAAPPVSASVQGGASAPGATRPGPAGGTLAG
ncbi:MAG TPA: SpoIID/LytB domain-containing protein [Solirubrobacteraceae bacterium]|nr:SpoIID/LytB domain-containing protein [Solirubrobacteraceae bacterium]